MLKVVFSYLIKDLGILGSSINQIQQALEPVEAAKEPTQDKNEANIVLYLLFLLFHINYKTHCKFYNYYMVNETSYKLADVSST